MPGFRSLLALTSGDRLDIFLTQQLHDRTRSYVKKLVDEGHVLVNGRHGKPALKLRAGDSIEVTFPDPDSLDLVPQDIPLTVVYEDSDLLVVDKPAGLTVHPGPGHADHTLVNAILARCPDLTGIKGTVRPGIVHRLDKDTSGLIMVAKNDLAQTGLSQQIKDRTITKRYTALVRGTLAKDEGVIDAPIGRDPGNRKRMAILEGGRTARTEFRVQAELPGWSLIEARPITGRTHQIRVHFASIGHPIFGDIVYGKRSPLLARQFLHAAQLDFRQPRTDAPIHCTSALPEDLQQVLCGMGWGNPVLENQPSYKVQV